MGYGTFETLRRQNAVLKGTVELNSGIQLAAWYNNCDTVTVRSDHHTLSLYVADGYESYQKTPHGWKNGGGPTLATAIKIAEHFGCKVDDLITH